MKGPRGAHVHYRMGLCQSLRTRRVNWKRVGGFLGWHCSGLGSFVRTVGALVSSAAGPQALQSRMSLSELCAMGWHCSLVIGLHFTDSDVGTLSFPSAPLRSPYCNCTSRDQGAHTG